MADWLLPTVKDRVAKVIDYFRARDEDTATMFLNNPVNPIIGSIRLVRATATAYRLEEWTGVNWETRTLEPAGGGTGAVTLIAARAALGIGTLGQQNSNQVDITGGTIVGTHIGNGSGLTGLDAGQLVLGFLPEPVFPNPLPARDASNLINLNASQLISGTVPAARIPGSQITGINGANVGSGINAANITTGLVPLARLGTGTPDATKVLKGDGTWGILSMIEYTKYYSTHLGTGVAFVDADISSAALVSWDKSLITPLGPFGADAGGGMPAYIPQASVNTLRVQRQGGAQVNYPAITFWYGVSKLI